MFECIHKQSIGIWCSDTASCQSNLREGLLIQTNATSGFARETEPLPRFKMRAFAYDQTPNHSVAARFGRIFPSVILGIRIPTENPLKSPLAQSASRLDPQTFLQSMYWFCSGEYDSSTPQTHLALRSQESLCFATSDLQVLWHHLSASTELYFGVLYCRVVVICRHLHSHPFLQAKTACTSISQLILFKSNHSSSVSAWLEPGLTLWAENKE